MKNLEKFLTAIIQKMNGIGKCQTKFIIHIFILYLKLRGRYNYQNMSRYGIYKEQSYRINFEKTFDFKSFNRKLIEENCSKELVWIFDPSYVTKSGKQTPGVGYFWSGSAGAMKWGIEIGGLAIGDAENHTAMHYHAKQTAPIKKGENLLKSYSSLLKEQSEEMHKLSKVLTVDAFFSKKEFVDDVVSMGFTVISRMRKGVYLRYRYLGEQKKGRGRKKEFGDKVDVLNLSTEHFKVFKEENDAIFYEGIVHIRSLKRWCKIVIMHTLKDGKVDKVFVYFSTDTEHIGMQILEYYRLRFQIEFLYRDAKQHLGLNQSQSRQEQALDFHFNISLSALNVAKTLHWFSIPVEHRPAFSMADVKTSYFNQSILDRIISLYGKDPLIEKNNPLIAELYNLGLCAA
jgi:hypothetical protein